ncbi:MAG: YbaB/EbfC family nucleoid-associated protein [Kouleothrix sp.]|nr:YbaB/EbfC family nucleoid-associated protein [Kouleothrix sp.]
MNPRQLQQMAQQMQKQMAKIQEELGSEMVEGTAGSYVSVVVNGHREIQSIKLAPEVVDPEDIETLQDLIVAAVADASKKAQELAEKRMGPLTQGMKMPGMF